MSSSQKLIPSWINVVTLFFAFMEIGVSITLFLSPQLVADNVDLTAQGVKFLFNIWATRQFSLGFILAYSFFKKSNSMLIICYIFFTVMFLGDFTIGILQKNNGLIIGGAVMSMVGAVIIYFLQKIKS